MMAPIFPREWGEDGSFSGRVEAVGGLWRVVVTMFVPGSGTWEFTSEAMDDTFAKVLLWSLSGGGPFTIQKAKKVRDQ